MHESPDPINHSIDCCDCAAVCCRLDVLLLPGDHVPSWFVTHDDAGIGYMAKHNDGWCVALDRDTMRCTIYQRRPQMCRDFPMGGTSCRDERRAWYGSASKRIPIAVLDSDG